MVTRESESFAIQQREAESWVQGEGKITGTKMSILWWALRLSRATRRV